MRKELDECQREPEVSGVTAVPVDPANLHDIVGASASRGVAPRHLQAADGGE